MLPDWLEKKIKIYTTGCTAVVVPNKTGGKSASVPIIYLGSNQWHSYISSGRSRVLQLCRVYEERRVSGRSRALQQCISREES